MSNPTTKHSAAISRKVTGTLCFSFDRPAQQSRLVNALLHASLAQERGTGTRTRAAFGKGIAMLQLPAWKLGLRAEVLGREALPTLLPLWEDLCRRSVEDNVYYSPRYARALLESVAQHEQIAFAVVWGDMRLVAFLPVTRPQFPIPALRPQGCAWQTKYTFSCMPLLDRSRKMEAAGALLDVLASISEGEWVLPTVNVEGEACRSLIAALGQRELPWVFLHRFQRASLEARGTLEEHMKSHVAAKRRKDIARNRRRLAELGTVEHETHCCGDALDRAVAAFLQIEANGWKGKRGTALACDERTRRFAVDAFAGEAGNSICRADVLTLSGVPIAVSLMALMGRTGFTVKCSYDEAYRSYSPGLLLETEVIRSFLSGDWADRLDSATAGTHVIESLWPGRIEVGDLVFSLSPRAAQLRLSALQLSEQMRSNIRGTAKQSFAWLTATIRSGLDTPRTKAGSTVASQRMAQST